MMPCEKIVLNRYMLGVHLRTVVRTVNEIRDVLANLQKIHQMGRVVARLYHAEVVEA